jgi:hypothetical protein
MANANVRYMGNDVEAGYQAARRSEFLLQRFDVRAYRELA